MKNVESLLYLLIIAVSVIISIANKIQKSRKNDTNEAPPAPKPKRVDTSASDRPRPLRQQATFADRIKLLPEEIEPVFSSLPTVSLDADDQPKEIMLEEEEVLPINIDLQDAQEARRAFIYSEIFSRKYN